MDPLPSPQSTRHRSSSVSSKLSIKSVRQSIRNEAKEAKEAYQEIGTFAKNYQWKKKGRSLLTKEMISTSDDFDIMMIGGIGFLTGCLN
jgi:hypothetical protein